MGVGGFLPMPRGARPARLPGARGVKAAAPHHRGLRTEEDWAWVQPEPQCARGLAFSGFL